MGRPSKGDRTEIRVRLRTDLLAWIDGQQGLERGDVLDAAITAYRDLLLEDEPGVALQPPTPPAVKATDPATPHRSFFKPEKLAKRR